ncbi:hypothetical protein BB561_000802 [Smittium simulii]|uniref:SH3 domain-containing protein n=1 Tax=Smittium simulii TaxID=133385 RepID=A0A2T9YXM2_9FUNG|nr:hypothetical protein BB561_000802 [Smittium simulii]
MNSTLKKNFSKLGQWTGEKFSKEDKIEVGDQFKNLYAETENKRIYSENLLAAFQLYVNQQVKKKEATDNSKIKISVSENFANSLLQLGEVLPRDSVYGKALKSFGQSQINISNFQIEHCLKAKTELLCALESESISFKEFSKLNKKFETRKTDYDSKNKKLLKSKKDENNHLHDDCRYAKIKYDDSYNEMFNKMQNFQDSEAKSLDSLYTFYLSQLEFHKKAYNSLQAIGDVFKHCLNTSREPARERLRSMRNTSIANPNTNTSSTPNPASQLQRNIIPKFFNRSNNPQASSEQERDDFDPHASNYNFPSDTNVANIENVSISNDISATKRRQPPPPPISKDKTQTSNSYRKALYDFTPSGPGELAFHVNDIIQVVEKIDDGWWSGIIIESANHLSAKTIGIFPVNYTDTYDFNMVSSSLFSQNIPSTILKDSIDDSKILKLSNYPTGVTKTVSNPDSCLHNTRNFDQIKVNYNHNNNISDESYEEQQKIITNRPRDLSRNHTMPDIIQTHHKTIKLM